MWTMLAVAAAVLMLSAALAVYYFGIPGVGALSRAGQSAESPLVIEGRAERQALPSGNESLNVTGQIQNPSGSPQRVPRIHAELVDANGRVVYSWFIAPPIGELRPGAAATFSAMEMGVPQGASGLILSLDAGPQQGQQQSVPVTS
jgi:hypothetical protein